jgi:Tol biopolymer transport system component
MAVTSLRMSPDGRLLAFSARTGEKRPEIWVRSLDTLEAHPVNGTEGASLFFWSPDSRYLGFAAHNNLMKIEASGGPAQTLCDLPKTMRGGAWGPDGTILFGSVSGIMRLPESGGTPVAVTQPKADEVYAFPSFLPDGRHFVYVLGSAQKNALYLGTLDATPEQQSTKPLATVPFPNVPVFAASPDPALAYVLFASDGALMALGLDLRRMAATGPAVRVDQGTGSGIVYSASATGVLAFRAGLASMRDSTLRWFDRQGRETGQLGPPAPYGNLRLSTDGRLLMADYRALAQDGFGSNALWSADVVRGVFSRVIPGPAANYAGVLAPDGRAAFTYYGPGSESGDIFVGHSSGSGRQELLVRSPAVKHPNDWSRDGNYLLYDEHTSKQKQDLLILKMSGSGAERTPVPFLATPADETDGAFSPDTKWIAYSSDESGQRQVYVQGFVPDHVPAAGVGKWQISPAGGAKPRWRQDGKELYYIATDGKLMALAVKSTATTFEPGLPVALFQTHTAGFSPYDVGPDGRFLVNTLPEDTSEVGLPITMVLNWTAGLKK